MDIEKLLQLSIETGYAQHKRTSTISPRSTVTKVMKQLGYRAFSRNNEWNSNATQVTFYYENSRYIVWITQNIDIGSIEVKALDRG